MQPHEIAAHRIADALRTIGQALNEASPEVVAQVAQWLDYNQNYVTTGGADKIAATAPFDAPAQAQIDDYVDEAIDMYSDQRVKDYVEDLLPQTDWQWRQALDEHRAMLVADIDMGGDAEPLELWDAMA